MDVVMAQPNYVIAPPAVSALPLAEGGAFPIRRIFCVGRNYAAHSREMGSDPTREPPFFFMKPADAALTADGDLPYPPMTKDLHYEMELVAALGTGGFAITPSEALAHVFGYAAGLDMTRRDLQAAAKQEKKPWDMGKGFDHSAPLGGLATSVKIGHPNRGRIALSVNGVVRQESDLDQMIWSVAEIIAHLSQFVTLASGDLVFTGTPAGVGAVVRGDLLEGEIAGVGRVHTRIV